VAKIVMLGYSQRDAIEALKHVDGNDVHDALAWLERRARAAA
jgi:Holliday junction resolvasome RuvABC DNA-binding subunit